MSIKPFLNEADQINLEIFIEFLKFYYFNENSRFKKKYRNYYAKLSENFEINSTTNSIESINKKLKYACNDGKISFQKACQTLCNFKADFRSEFE